MMRGDTSCVDARLAQGHARDTAADWIGLTSQGSTVEHQAARSVPANDPLRTLPSQPVQTDGIVAKTIGCANQIPGSTRVERIRNQRQQQRTHAIPIESMIPVAGVLAILEPAAGEVATKIGALQAQQRTHESPGTPFGHSAQCGGARPANETHEDRLGLVVEGVSGRDPICRDPFTALQQEVAPYPPRRFLRRFAPSPQPFDLSTIVQEGE